MTPLRPLFEGPAAAASTTVLAAAGPAPRIDLDVLARALCVPALDGEYQPGAPWRGVHRLRRTPPTPGRSPLTGPSWRPKLRAAFERAVAQTVTGHDRVAVSLSGGLDSLAVLLTARAQLGAAQVQAVTLDLLDDHGRRTGNVTRGQLEALAPDCAHTVIDPADAVTRPEPAWDPNGPRLDALPALNALVNAAAAEAGASVLLSGDGADEHLAVPRYATALIAAAHGPRGALRYLTDLHGVDTGITGELLAAAACTLPRRARGGLYWAANWPQWCHPQAPEVLAEPYRSRASAWSRAVTAAARRAHIADGRSWAESDAFDAIHPHDPIPAAGELPEASPFLAAPMLDVAAALPLAYRYDPAGRTAYQRAKAPVLALLAGTDPAQLPAAKQHFRDAITGGDNDPVAVPALHDAGVLACRRLDHTNSDPALRRAARGVETWLVEARTRGHHP